MLIPGRNVRMLIGFDPDRDKFGIQQRDHRGIDVRRLIHHVTGMTPHGREIEQDQLVFRLRTFKSLGSPCSPVDGRCRGLMVLDSQPGRRKPENDTRNKANEPWDSKNMKAEMRHGRYSRERSSPTQWNAGPSRRLGHQASGERREETRNGSGCGGANGFVLIFHERFEAGNQFSSTDPAQ